MSKDKSFPTDSALLPRRGILVLDRVLYFDFSTVLVLIILVPILGTVLFLVGLL